MCKFILAFLLIIAAPRIMAQPGKLENDKGAALFEAKKYAEALTWFKAGAAKGYPKSLYNVGLALENGYGVAKNVPQAITWYEKAGAKGHVQAMDNVAAIYHLGDGVPKDLAKALYWYKKSAETGSKDDMFNAGVMYLYGEGTETDFSAAMAWFKRGEAAGNEKCKPAQDSVRFKAFRAGWNAAQAKNYDTSFKLYTLSADWGVWGAINNLGLQYLQAQGTAPDTAKAIHLMAQTAGYGFEPSIGLLKWTNDRKVVPKSKEAQMDVYNAALALLNRNDYKNSFDLFLIAANSYNLPEAYYQIGRMWDYGLGRPGNYNSARNFYKSAAGKGNEEAKQQLKTLSRRYNIWYARNKNFIKQSSVNLAEGSFSEVVKWDLTPDNEMEYAVVVASYGYKKGAGVPFGAAFTFSVVDANNMVVAEQRMGNSANGYNFNFKVAKAGTYSIRATYDQKDCMGCSGRDKPGAFGMKYTFMNYNRVYEDN